MSSKAWYAVHTYSGHETKVKTNIKADAALKAVFGGKAVVTMFEMTKLVSQHIK